jgi:hypothetical protein
MELYLLTPINRKINLKMNNQILNKRMIMEAKILILLRMSSLIIIQKNFLYR